MTNKIRTIEPSYDTPSAEVPWLWFLFLSVVFFITQHNLLYSLQASEVSGTAVFGTTVDEFSEIVEQGNLLRQVVFFFLGILATVRLLKDRTWRVKVNAPLGWLLLIFLCWAFMSLIWSENPELTIKRLVLLATFVLGALAVAQHFSSRHMILWVFFSTVLYLNVGIAAELWLGTFHPFSWGYRFAGTIHPNSQSLNCVLLLYASLFLLKDERRWRRFLFAATLEALIFLFLTKCRTSLAIAGVALLLYWSLEAPLSRKAFAVICLLWLSCLVILFSEIFFPIFEHAIGLGRRDSETLTLSGRIPLWGQVLSYIEKQPIQGYGYGCFWSLRHIEEVANLQGWAVTHAHSVYLELSLGLGLVGGITYVLIIIAGIGRALTVNRYSYDTQFGFMVVVLIFAGLDGLLEPVTIMPSHVMFVNMVLLAELGFSKRYLV